MKRWLARIATILVAAILAYAIAMLLSGSYCTLSEQLRVWMLSFFCLLGGAMFFVERRFGASSSRAAALAVIVVLVAILFAGLSAANLFGAIARSRQIGSRADLRSIADALEAERVRNGAFPTVSSVAEFNSFVGKSFPTLDRWGTPILLISEPSRSVVVSFGECGKPEQLDPWGYQPGATHDTRADTAYLDGKAWRYPEGLQE